MRFLHALALSVVLQCAARAADSDFLNRIETTNEFISVTLPSADPLVARVGKYLLPARDDAGLLGPLFQNVQRHRFHFEFLAATFPDRFPALTFEDYLDLVMRRSTRDYYAGTLTHYLGPEGRSYGFTVLTDGSDPDELLGAEEVRAVYERLRGVFALEPLEYAPQRSAAILEARRWENPGFPIRGVGDQQLPDVVGYTPATNYGVLRRYTLASLAAADENGELDRQTIVVVDEAPVDIETAIAGLITAAPQGELSHLATRLARREVPNAFVQNALEELASRDGQLVRLGVTLDEYTVAEATLEEAEAWWEEHRPTAPPIPEADADYAGFDRLDSIDVEEGATAVLRRFGGKAAGLAVLYRYLPERYRTPGFAVPFRYYLEFMRSNTIASLAAPEVLVSYEEYLEELLQDETFRADGAFRRAALEDFRDHMREHGAVSAELVEALRARIQEVFADPQVKVRFRSSSNAEDSLQLTGAGLYDSTSVCLADELDGDESGPSRCDSSKSKERTIERALKKVWASLWNHRAFEEREYFQVDHTRAAMALAVTLAYPDEDSNGVLFTGDPANRDDRRFVVNVQLGDESVVSPGVGVESEKSLLVLDDDSVRKIVRVRPSSLTVPDQNVLSDSQLEELGTVLAATVDDYLSHYDLGGHTPDDVLVDFEFKFQDGQLVVKQARPFLRGDSGTDGPRFLLDVAPSLTLCSQFKDDRAAYDEYRLKSRMMLPGGLVELRARSVHVVADIIGELAFGPSARVLEPMNSGLFELEVRSGGTFYAWEYTQDFALEDGVLQVRFERTFHKDDSEDGVFRWSLDERALENSFAVFADVEPAGDEVRYGSCDYESLPLWEIRAVLEGEQSVRFLKRYQEPFAGSGPVALVSGESFLEGVERAESDFWRLVYAAEHHNFNEEFVQVFDPPITVGETGGVGGIYLREEFRGTPAVAALVDPRFRVLRRLDVVSYSEEILGTEPEVFARGDANADSSLDLSDSVFILSYLFLGGSAPGCLKAGDVDDSGAVEITDPIYLMEHLFLGGPPPLAPFPACGVDPSADALTCVEPPACRPFEGLTVEIAPETTLFSIWSEGYDTTSEQHAVLSQIRFREGTYQVFTDRDTEGLDWIESLLFGPNLTPAEPQDDGTFFHRPEEFYPLEYRQSFATPVAEWTFRFYYRPGTATRQTLDCTFLDASVPGEAEARFLAELVTPEGRRSIHYSCLAPGVWSPARTPASPLRLSLEDGTTLVVQVAESYFFRGVAGETSNRYLPAADVGFRGRSLTIRAQEQLIYAGLHHNWQQQYRVLFDEPIEGVYGIDIVDCPEGTTPPCLATTVAGTSRAHLLNAALERSTELVVTGVAFGEE